MTGAAACCLSLLVLASLEGGDDGRLLALLEEGIALVKEGDLTAAEAKATEALALARRGDDLQGEAESLLLFALVKSCRKEPDEALEAYDESLRIFQDRGDLFGAWLVATGRGETLRLLGRSEEAQGAFQAALEALHKLQSSGNPLSLRSFRMFARGQGVPPELLEVMEPLLAFALPWVLRTTEALTLTRLAVLQHQQGDDEAAIRNLDEALELSQPLGLGDGLILKERGRILAALERWDEAAVDLEKGLAAAERMPDRSLALEILDELAEVEIARERLAAARGYLERLLTGTRDRRREARVLNDLAWIDERRGRYGDALAHLEAALGIAREVDVPELEATVLGNLVPVYLALARTPDAERSLERSLELARQTSDREQEGLALTSLAEVLRVQGRLEEAAATLERTRALARELSHPEMEGAALNGLAAVATMRGRFQEALGLQRQALDLARRRRTVYEEIVARMNLATIYAQLEEVDLAGRQARRALALARRLDNPKLERLALERMGLILLRSEGPQMARRTYARALALARESADAAGEIASLIALAAIDLESGSPDEMVARLQLALARAREAKQVEGQAAAHQLLGLAYLRLGRHDEALAELEAGLRLFDEAGMGYAGALSSGLVGVLHYAEEGPREAAQWLEGAADRLEAIGGGIGVDELAAAFAAFTPQLMADTVVQLAAEREDGRTAFLYAEKARARAFLRQMGNPPIDPKSGAAPDLLTEEQSVRQRMEVLARQLAAARSADVQLTPSPLTLGLEGALAAARERYRELQVELKERHPEYSSLVQAEVLSLDEVQARAVGEGRTLVVYYVLGRQVLAWVIHPDEARMIPLALTARELEERVRYLRAGIESGDLDFATAGLLYQRLIAPLAPHLRHSDLLLVPHGVLHALPFGALWNEAAGRFLLQEFTLTLAPSASVLPFVEAKQSPFEGRVLVLGDPDGELLAAAAEAEAVARVHGVQPLLGAEAQEAVVYERAGRIDLLHIAAHGVHDPRAPLFSRLDLAPGGGQDGHLEVHEVFNLDLAGADLVVLSACDSALGERTRGDEVVGLTRAFLYAGSPAVVTSLWRIDDAASGALMAAFHRHLRGGEEPAAALRSAQLEVMAEEGWRSPYYWAPFTLTGAPRHPGGPRETAALSP